MTGFPLRTFADAIVGRTKRALGELTGRPDLVLEGERQEAKGRRRGWLLRRRARGDRSDNNRPP